MPHSLPVPPETLPGMTTGRSSRCGTTSPEQYSWRCGSQVPFAVLRHAGDQASAATITASAGPTDTGALATLRSRQITGAMRQTGQTSTQERMGPWHA